MSNPSKQKGYTLLFAVLTATLVLGVAVFILNISRKQFLLASTARDSMFSLYSADSGIECVAANKAALSPSKPQAITCDGQTITPSFSNKTYTDSSGNSHPDAEQATFNFGFSYTDASGHTGALGSNGCADMTVIQYADLTNPAITDTVMDSRGYNFCSNTFGPDTSNARTVERALELTY